MFNRADFASDRRFPFLHNSMRTPRLFRSAVALVVGGVFTASVAASPAKAQARREGTVLKSTVGGLLGLGAGAVVGAAAGWAIGRNDCPSNFLEECLSRTLPGSFWGATAGASIGIPLGAHIGGPRNTSVIPALIGSAVIFGAEVLAIRPAVHRERFAAKDIAIVSLAPALQLAVSVALATRRKP